MKKFRFHLVVDHPGLKWNLERDARWPDKPALGEIMYFAPDLEAKVIEVTRLTNRRKPRWRVFLVPWSGSLGKGDIEEVESAESRMGELAENGPQTLEGSWEGPWSVHGPRERKSPEP